jgi:hypothetical protein
VHTGHFSRSTLRDGVLEFASNVGEVFGVESTLRAVTMVSFGADGSSAGSLVLVVVTADVLVCAASFILALDLVGGMYLVTFGVQGSGRLNNGGSVLLPSLRERRRKLADSCGGATAVAPTATRSDRIRRYQVNRQGAKA